VVTGKKRGASALGFFAGLATGVVIFIGSPLPSLAMEPGLSAFVKPDAVPAPLFNPPTAQKIELGKRLFFDRHLSGGNSMSCASCHQPDYAWTDRRRFSLGETGTPRPRHTPSLQDVGWNKLFARDGRVETLEGFVLGPIGHPLEMNQNLDQLSNELTALGDYSARFDRAFGKAAISLDAIAQSLASYVRTLKSGTSSFDAWVAGDAHALSTQAQDGFALFVGKAGCVQCHQGWRFTDQQFHDIGLRTIDKGRGMYEPDSVSAQYAFKTPSLRNVAARPPYMHNGALSSLEQVIDHYQSGFLQRPSLSPQMQPLDLSTQEKLNLVVFLESLTDVN